MKPTELRIGNLILWEDDSHDIVEVIGIGRGREKFIENDIFIHYKETSRVEEGNALLSEFIPIKITEEWLEKLGFRKLIAWYIVIDKFNTLELGHNNDSSTLQYYVYYRELSEKDFVRLRRNLKYVHELQNLYFALTGKQLTLKNTTDENKGK